MSVVTLDRGAVRRLLQRDGVARDLKERGERVAERQQQLAPRGEGKHVADTVEARLARDDDGLVCTIGPRGAKSFYAWFREFGTFNSAAQPFIRPSLEAAK